MKNVLIILIALSTSLGVFAETFNQEKAISEISTAASKISSLQCDFVQTKALKMLGDKMVSTGKLYSKQPDKIRWEYSSPYAYSFIMDGAKVKIVKDKRSNVMDVNQNKLFKEIARVMINSFTGKCLDDDKDVKASVSAKNDTYIITLLPVRKEMKHMLSKIVLYYDRRSSVVNRVDLFEKNGDSTSIVLKNIKKNSPINASFFKID